LVIEPSEARCARPLTILEEREKVVHEGTRFMQASPNGVADADYLIDVSATEGELFKHCAKVDAASSPDPAIRETVRNDRRCGPTVGGDLKHRDARRSRRRLRRGRSG
jgi:hypothetical protein